MSLSLSFSYFLSLRGVKKKKSDSPETQISKVWVKSSTDRKQQLDAIKLTCKWGSWRYRKWWALSRIPPRQYRELADDLETGEGFKTQLSFICSTDVHIHVFEKGKKALCCKKHSCDFLKCSHAALAICQPQTVSHNYTASPFLIYI